MFNLIKKIFGTEPKRLPGTIMEPMTPQEAAAFWAMMRRQDKESGGW